MSESDDAELETDTVDDDATHADRPWSEEEMPLAWLFGQKSRAKLVLYAVKRADETDLPYVSKVELAEEVGVSRNVVHQYIDGLVTVGIYETRGGDGSFVRYRPNTASSIVVALQSANEEMVSASDSE